MNTTKFDKNTILKDFSSDEGSTIEIQEIGSEARGGASGILIDPSMIQSLAGIDDSDKKYLSNQTLGMALTILHEYGHYGDEKIMDVKQVNIL